ncbi:hypothetical protein A2276_07305 [candidate division WOR-1 bacterium RIFOXYA12_FULL_43_27]|uniref:GxxExxY protein n=1 Tax=candidate division WOR-1 bacterium RIFOXYC2_FULL_46_14 TaxID=1802587 RepID=A0A1F4U5V9_UNCSA|nr:MAG: hypothetical protein A2276_07305 [candidate division WOR-1 bacterium RIFOXYA12_FULL_43_27]OGC20414.1 MAG: hypothetical protein A2292_05130 [candidate division WOR-1 bacterium RIFOXYB2_FULL_46_45]OGC31849.1 MAG: hypothetical protein A2232_06320 [candidate division WOR-1 bacterium RIFOXYA2_FULL_46_56]OGC40259.1 MAG: hypothetical protein A2438_03150 [candidate division WOR-1 bacterium RIFOXYC2_FULL_46_14]
MEEKIVYKELSYRIMGILFDVHNTMGGGYQEKYYQKAIKLSLVEQKIPFLEQVRTDLVVHGQIIGRYYIDFVIDHKVVLEIKSRINFSKRDIIQVLGYLRQSNLNLGILASFSTDGLKYKRILKGFENRFEHSSP